MRASSGATEENMKRRKTFSDNFDCEEALKFNLSDYYKKTEPVKPKTISELISCVDKIVEKSQEHPMEKITIWVFDDKLHGHKEFAVVKSKDDLFGSLMDASLFGYSIHYVYEKLRGWPPHPHFSSGIVLHKPANFETNIIPEVLEHFGKINWGK